MVSSSDCSVLIVEDEDALADLFEMWLQDDYNVKTVTQGKHAISHLDDSLDILVLDWRMPDITGDVILDEIRDRGLEYGIVLVTGFEPDLTTGGDVVDAALTKPIDREDLLGIVDQLATGTLT